MSEIPASFSTLSGTLSDLSDLSVFKEDIHPKVQGHVRVQAAQQNPSGSFVYDKRDEDPDTEAKVA